MTAVAYIWYNAKGEPLAPTEREMITISQRRPTGPRPTFQLGCIHNFSFVRETRVELDRQIDRFGRILARYAPQARIVDSKITRACPSGYRFSVTYSVEDPDPRNHRLLPRDPMRRMLEPDDRDEPLLAA